MIRGPLFSDEQLARHARALADSHVTLPRARPVVSLLTRMRDNQRILRDNYDAIMATVEKDEQISSSAEWFIDNFHSIEKQVQMVRRDLPRSYFRLLPKLGPGFLEGHPRMFGIMWAYVSHTDSAFDPDQLANYVQAYSSRSPLELGELWAAAINLRVLLVENARRLSSQIVTADRERLLADDVANRLLGIDNDPDSDAARATLDEAYPPWREREPSLPFAVQLLRRLTEGPALDAVTWIHESLAARDLDPHTAVQHELAKQSQATLTMRNIVTSMRKLDDVDWETWLESISAVERELSRSPGYRESDFATRNLYRSHVERLARGSEQDELTITRRAVRFAAEGADEVGQHVGYWFIDDGAALLERAVGYRRTARERVINAIRGAGIGGYVGAVAILTILITGLITWGVASVWAGLPIGLAVLLGVLLALPASDFVVARLGTRLTRLIPTVPMPELRMDEGVPQEYRTLVVVPTMITSEDAVRETLVSLETHFLANDNGEIYFAAATDWADADTPEREGDLELLEATRAGVADLNATYGSRFLLFHRERVWNESEGVWMGWERKRGKLEELNRVLRGATDTSITTIEGHLPGPFRYVITLDADTLLPRTAAKRLVGTIAHPLNRAHFASDDPHARVIRGYTILQPRVTPALPAQEDTSTFQMLYSTRQGLDPYTFAVADLYQDLFGEGSFAGKGIYDIAALDRALAGRIPENAVLSHDLLEGNYSRSGYVSDVEVVEEHPTSYGVDISRNHRWTRGDWQLLPWIFGKRRRDMSGLGTWKMVDNLRRSLAPVSAILSIIVAAVILPPGPLAVWIATIAAMVVIPNLLPALHSLLGFRRGFTFSSQLRASGRDIGRALAVGLLDFVFLAHRAAYMLDAIVRTLWRMAVTHRNMLEWTTAAAAGRSAGGGLTWFARRMGGGFLVPLALIVIAVFRPEIAWAVALPVLLWLLAPVAAWRVSRPITPLEQATTPETAARLRAIARRTWRFFEVFVNAGESDLPPDNFQEDPSDKVAHRTSPTNIGMYYLSAVAARDLGWIGLADVTDRLRATMRTQISLDHYEGHLFNWYDTETTLPLNPRYVSSVDSGNLAGHLLVLANACVDLAAHDPRHDDVRPGVLDALTCVAESDPALDLTQIRAAVEAVDLSQVAAETAGWERVLSAVVEAAATVPTDSDAADWLTATEGSVRSRIRDLQLTDAERDRVRIRLRWVEAEARREVEAMNFRLVHDRKSDLLSVGFNPDTEEMDESTYDMIASECRLASFVAIAKGDLRTKHWSRLGRSLTSVNGRAALLSWSGSMFEYLMPTLVMRSPADGLLATTKERVVERQMEHGREHGIPWGVSESGFNARDRELNYQYGPFGVPGLGVVRGLADNLVIAPYATGLAAQIQPEAALENYRALKRIGARGRYGYYEAVDFTSERLPRDTEYAVVRNYMAHHSGMTIVAIHNVLTGGIMREWFHREPMVRATDLLLHEAEPRLAPVVHARTDELDPTRKRHVRSVVPPSDRELVGPRLNKRTIGTLSNGRLSLTATPSGATHLRWNGLSITRWHPDLTTDSSGSAIYIRDRSTGDFHIPTEYPLFEGGISATARFAEDSVLFHRTENRVTSSVESRISPEADAWVQTVSVRNLSGQNLDMDVVTASELTLGRRADDDAHPAFSKMFVRTEFRDGVLLATRKRRSSSDPEVWAAQFVTGSEDPHAIGHDQDTPLGVETDGRKFIGRGRSLRNPIQVEPGGGPSGTTGYVMEPVLSLRTRLVVPNGERGEFHLWTVVAHTEEDVLRLVDAHRSTGAYERLATLAFTSSQGQLRHLGITPAEAAVIQNLAGALVYPDPGMRAPVEKLEAAASQADLWALGISGDLPIMVVRIDDEEDIDLVRQAVRAFEYMRLRRITVDLVLVAEHGGYLAELQRRLEAIANSVQYHVGAPDSGGRVFVVRRDLASPDALAALFGSAAVVLVAKRGDLADQLAFMPAIMSRRVDLPAPAIPKTPPVSDEPLRLESGYGGFSLDGREYVVVTSADHPTPAPWTNVVANAEFGFHATAEGAGYTWWGNSRDNQLTPWRNQPIESPRSEVLYVQDLGSGTAASLGSGAIPGGVHETRHGFGYTTYRTAMADLELEQTMFVPLAGAVKTSLVRVQNTGSSARTVRVTWYAEPVLGQNQTDNARHLITSLDEATGALVVRNPWSPQRPGQVAFVDMAGGQTHWTGDRTEFLGRHGTVAAPAALARVRTHGVNGVAGGAALLEGLTVGNLSGRVGAGLDPCLAISRDVRVEPGESVEVTITFGASAAADDVAGLVSSHRQTDWHAELASVRSHWEDRLGAVRVRTPDESFDVLMNGWLLYQTLASRIAARSGYYQASGAFGFRDQLQDSMTAVFVEPELARTHLLTAAGRQFREGDVQHWWLPGTGDGIRTRITDDVVWLAYVAAHYLRVTGDWDVLDEKVPFLVGPELEEGEHERYFRPDVSEETVSLYEHCLIALRHAMRYGFHGLPLMGTGDWNDGMNRVGQDGRGESVWLGWFLVTTLDQFSRVAERRGDTAVVEEFAAERARLVAALEAEGWDGEWYRRGYFDDGTPLGSKDRTECRIDAIAQSWAVLSGRALPERGQMAMEAVQRELEVPRVGILRLFTPPFEFSDPDPGYIRAYPPGVRENGGQYTHGALWSIFAWSALGRVDRAYELFAMLNPVNHARDRGAADVYTVEPYVVAADVYSVAPFEGKGGWTWYTGSSGWMYRAGLEAVLGIRREAGVLVVTPQLPPGWDSAQVEFRHGGTTTVLAFQREAAGSEYEPAGGEREHARAEREHAPTERKLADDGAEPRASEHGALRIPLDPSAPLPAPVPEPVTTPEGFRRFELRVH